jgi:hypothetical protein
MINRLMFILRYTKCYEKTYLYSADFTCLIEL